MEVLVLEYKDLEHLLTRFFEAGARVLMSS